MIQPRKALLAWSSGKDSAHTLHAVRQSGDFEVVGLVTTLSAPVGRVTVHQVREALLESQAAACGLPLVKLSIPDPCPNETYDRVMGEAMAAARQAGIEHVLFGDLFLEDIRAYREQRLAAAGMHCHFPLWGRNTADLAEEMLECGLRAMVTCVDGAKLAAEHAGAAFDRPFLSALPDGVDPCGERGEFHTFVWDSPAFRQPVPVRAGAHREQGGFVYADLVPA